MTDPTPLPPEERFKEFEDPHFHDEDDEEGAIHHGEVARKKPVKAKPKPVPNPRRRFDDD